MQSNEPYNVKLGCSFNRKDVVALLRENKMMPSFKDIAYEEFSDGLHQNIDFADADENLDYINRVLKDLYGYSHISMVEMIRND